MTIDSYKIDKTIAVLALTGRLDTINAPVLERKIKHYEDGAEEIVLDFSGLEYISSMGLRVLLKAKKELKEKEKKLTIKNINKSVKEVFEITGFMNIMVHDEHVVMVRKDESGGIVLFFNGELLKESYHIEFKALMAIKKEFSPRPVTIIFDMEKLISISPEALKGLKEAIDETAWEGRTLCIRNVSADIRKMLENEGLGNLLEA
jgi:anti-sigma B factor antagonist